MTQSTLIPISHLIWEQKYRFHAPDGGAETSIEASWRRVATAIAQAESEHSQAHWAERFYNALSGFEFLPGATPHLKSQI